MANSDILLVKQLAGKEDLLHGYGKEVQVRNGRNIEITKINASVFDYQYSDANGSQITDPTKIKTIADALDYLIYNKAV